MFCYSNNGHSMRAVEDDYIPIAGEMVFQDYATEAQLIEAFPEYESKLEKQLIINQMSALEASVTPRRIREAALGIDNRWLESVEEEIAALRAQL